MRTLILLFLTSLCFAQPDAPQPQKSPCGWSGCWDYSHPNLSVGQTLKSPWFWGPVGASEAAYWTDVYTSRQAFKRGCVETNQDLSPHPSLSEYTANWAKTELLLDAFQWAIVKLNRKPTNYIATAMGVARVTIHSRGIYAGLNCP